MEARRISVSLRRDPREIAERHSQANPLTLRCELARGEEVTETLALYAELHTSRTPASAPVATAGPVAMTAASVGPWELDFSAAQMNQTVLPGEDKEYWLVIYATGANDLLLTLGTIRLTLAYDNISQVTPAPPEPALILAFRTIAVAGQSSIVADSSADTLTIAAGNGIVLTTNPATDTLTITAAGGAGSGDVTGPNGATDNAIARFDGTTGKIIQSSTATLSDAGGIAADTLAISATPTGAGGTGIFRYDTGEKVPEVGIDGITLKIGVQEYVRVYNATVGTLTKGQIVYISGAQGNRVAVQLADASVEATSAGTLGLVAQSITAGSEGFVQVSGPMYSLNTAGLTAGALLYLSETAGQWTQTEPPAPAHGVRIGYVQRVDNNVGSIFIKVDNGYELGELHNVSDGVTGTIAFLVKSLATGIWESKNSADTRSALGLGTLATQSGTFSGTSSGTNTGDVTLAGQTYLSLAGQTITAAQVNLASHVTGDLPLSNLAQAPDPSVILGRRSGSAGDYEPITLGTNLSMDGTVLNASGGGGGAPTDADYLVKTANGSLSAERVVGDSATITANWTTAGQVSFERAALTGDVTASANSNTTTIANDAVTYAKIQNVSASRLIGRASGTSGDIEEITLGTNLSFSGTTLNAAGGGSATVDVQRFAASGDWTNPSPSSPRPVKVLLVGGGGGGGGGRCDVAGTLRYGGGGGGGGAVVEVMMQSDQLASSVSVTIGAGGTSGAGGASQPANGATGGNGGDTTFSVLTARGGNGGVGGSTVAGTGGAGVTGSTLFMGSANPVSSQAGGTAAAGTPGAVAYYVPTGGAGGASVTTLNAGQGAGNGQAMGNTTTGQTLGGSAGQPGVTQNGGAGLTRMLYGTGGGGGAGNGSGGGGNGGAGGAYGGGGGGGGGGLDGGGSGGVGGGGYALIITYL